MIPGDDGGYNPAPGCCRATGVAFRYVLEERDNAWVPWHILAQTAEHGELDCGTIYLGPPNNADYCCEAPLPAPISLPVETCAQMLPGREYRFVYEAPFRPYEYINQVPPLTATGGHPYHVITGGSTCGGDGCGGSAAKSASPAACIKLYVDPDLDLQDLETETWEYIPEGRLPGPAPAPTTINLVATMPASENWPPIEVMFTCQSSAWLGDAGNRSAYTEPDFSISGSYFSTFTPLPGTDLVVAFTQVAVTDWGGEALFTVAPINDPTAAVPLFVPVGAEIDHLPDAWMAEHDDLVSATISAAGLVACDDDDAEPVGTGVAGDGLATWEEYRGFFVNGRHVRTDPRLKDLFFSIRKAPLSPPSAGLPSGDVVHALPLASHVLDVLDTWLDSATMLRLFNRNIGPRPLTPCDALSSQRAVDVMVDYLNAAPGSLGVTEFLPPHGCVPAGGGSVMEMIAAPNRVRLSTIFVGRARISTPPNFDPTSLDSPDQVLIEYLLAHEVGHTVNLTHYTPFPDLCPYWCPSPHDGGFLFPSSDSACAGAGVAPSRNPLVPPESAGMHRGEPDESCPLSQCLAQSLRVDCPGALPALSSPVRTPTASCGAASVMASLPGYWARPTCGTASGGFPAGAAPWSDTCVVGTDYWTNLPATYSPLDSVQLQVHE